MTGEPTTLSETILAENRGVWDAMQDHRFVEDIVAGRLPAEVFRRYLVYEGAFVETAMAIFALALAKAPKHRQRLWLAGVVDALAREQIPYFEQRFATLGINPADYEPLPPSVVAFRDGMLGIAETGDYADIIVAMLAAEWMYATWCGRAAKTEITDPDVRRWVALHAEPSFLAQAEWLRTEIDAIGRDATPETRGRLSGVFKTVLTLEITFHTAAYES